MTQQINATFADLHVPVSSKKLEYAGQDLYSKLTNNENKTVTIESAPVKFIGADGNQYDTGRYTLGLRNGEITGIVSRRYTFVANEVAHKLILDAGFKPTDVKFSKSGNAMFAEVFDDDVQGLGRHQFTVDNNGDSVKLGVMIRNSIDGTTSLGGDIFTYRARCGNGAIVGKKALGSFSVKHVGEYTRLVSVFRTYLERAFKLAQKVKPFYQKATEVSVNQAFAEAFVKTAIPQKFLPDIITIDEGKVILGDKSTTVWDAFNQSTEKVWHLENLSVTSKITYTQRANAWLLNAVEPLVVA